MPLQLLLAPENTKTQTGNKIHTGPFSQQIFSLVIAGKVQVFSMTSQQLRCIEVSQHARHEDPETERYHWGHWGYALSVDPLPRQTSWRVIAGKARVKHIFVNDGSVPSSATVSCASEPACTRTRTLELAHLPFNLINYTCALPNGLLGQSFCGPFSTKTYWHSSKSTCVNGKMNYAAFNLDRCHTVVVEPSLMLLVAPVHILPSRAKMSAVGTAYFVWIWGF